MYTWLKHLHSALPVCTLIKLCIWSVSCSAWKIKVRLAVTMQHSTCQASSNVLLCSFKREAKLRPCGFCLLSVMLHLHEWMETCRSIAWNITWKCYIYAFIIHSQGKILVKIWKRPAPSCNLSHIYTVETSLVTLVQSFVFAQETNLGSKIQVQVHI